MCGRFALHSSEQTLQAVFGVQLPQDLAPRFNIPPTDPILGIRVADGIRRASRWRWGLVPQSIATKRGLRGKPLINARSESASTRTLFKYALRYRRVLIPADGFFEWRKTDRGKQPLHFQVGNEPFAMGGLYEHATLADGSPIDSATILTTEANALVSTVHHRMPVIIPRDDWDLWLDPKTDEGGIAHLLAPYPPQAMTMREVSERVNHVRHDDPGCIGPPEPPADQLRLF